MAVAPFKMSRYPTYHFTYTAGAYRSRGLAWGREIYGAWAGKDLQGPPTCPPNMPTIRRRCAAAPSPFPNARMGKYAPHPSPRQRSWLRAGLRPEAAADLPPAANRAARCAPPRTLRPCRPPTANSHYPLERLNAQRPWPPSMSTQPIRKAFRSIC